jgi:hypothetical protein
MRDCSRQIARVAVCVISVLLTAALCTGSCVQAQAQGSVPVAKTMLVEPPTPLLPERFGAWQHVKSESDGSLAAAYDGFTETVLKEDGLTRFASSTYKRDGSGETILMKAFQFGDATGAVAAYTYFRSPEGHTAPQLKLGPDASLAGNGFLTFRDGTTVIETDYNDGLRASDLTALEVTLPKVGGPAGIAPQLPTLLPAKGLDAGSLRYALGPASYREMGGVLPAEMMGFEKSAEAVTAKYKEGGVLTLLLYPTPEIAGEHEREIEALSRQSGTALAGTVKMRREGTLLILTSGAWPLDEAQKMVDGIHLRSEVTWNKPVPLDYQTEVRKTFSLLVNITIFCCLAFLAAIVLALFLGGGRALVRVMQGKPAATEPEFLHIDLSGPVGKPLRGSKE